MKAAHGQIRENAHRPVRGGSLTDLNWNRTGLRSWKAV